jgi:hypothetical protein
LGAPGIDGVNGFGGPGTNDGSATAVTPLAGKNGASRSQAIRRLVKLGLTVKARPKQPSRARADKAKAMAANQLDRLASEAATTQEQASRKGRLLKGPEEFQNVRVDRPAAK